MERVQSYSHRATKPLAEIKPKQVCVNFSMDESREGEYIRPFTMRISPSEFVMSEAIHALQDDKLTRDAKLLLMC